MVHFSALLCPNWGFRLAIEAALESAYSAKRKAEEFKKVGLQHPTSTRPHLYSACPPTST